MLSTYCVSSTFLGIEVKMNVRVSICGVLDAKGNRTASTMYRTAGAESREESGVERGAVACVGCVGGHVSPPPSLVVCHI